MKWLVMAESIAGGGGLPIADRLSLIGEVREVGAVLFRRPCPSGPHLPLIAGATGAHNPVGLGSPDQGASQGSVEPLGSIGKRST